MIEAIFPIDQNEEGSEEDFFGGDSIPIFGSEVVFGVASSSQS
jgi:hypothetical protein